MHLSINLNKISLIRNSRGGNYPSIQEFAIQLLDLGVDGITLHPRPDLRHATPLDCEVINDICKKNHKEFNIEGNPLSPESEIFPGFLKLIESINPIQTTLVPDEQSQITSDHGYDKEHMTEAFYRVVTSIAKHTQRVSIFVDAGFEELDFIKSKGIDCVEIYTGPFAEAVNSKDDLEIEREITKIKKTFAAAKACGIRVHIGHDLNLDNLKLISQVGDFDEASIGHAFLVDSIKYGIIAATELYLKEVK